MKQSLKKKLILISVVLALFAGTAFVILKKATDNSAEDARAGTELAEGEINFGPPTEEEKAQADANKDKVANQLETESQTPGGTKKQVTPIVTYAEHVDQEIRVNAYIAGVFEDGGTCTFILSKDGQALTKSTQSAANVSTTDCARLVVPRGEFGSSGTWQVKVTYNSDGVQGESGTSTFTVR